MNDAGTHDPDGVLAVWSIQNLLQRPEYIFHCQVLLHLQEPPLLRVANTVLVPGYDNTISRIPSNVDSWRYLFGSDCYVGHARK